MSMKPDFLNTLLKEPDGFSKYVKLFINYQGRKLSHAMLVFYTSLIIKALKYLSYYTRHCAIPQQEKFSGKNNHRKINSENHVSQNVNGMSLSIG